MPTPLSRGRKEVGHTPTLSRVLRMPEVPGIQLCPDGEEPLFLTKGDRYAFRVEDCPGCGSQTGLFHSVFILHQEMEPTTLASTGDAYWKLVINTCHTGPSGAFLVGFWYYGSQDLMALEKPLETE